MVPKHQGMLKNQGMSKIEEKAIFFVSPIMLDAGPFTDIGSFEIMIKLHKIRTINVLVAKLNQRQRNKVVTVLHLFALGRMLIQGRCAGQNMRATFFLPESFLAWSYWLV